MIHGIGRLRLLLAVATLVGLFGASDASAHAFRPGLLVVAARGEGAYELRWTPPAVRPGGAPAELLVPSLPPSCEGPRRPRVWRVSCGPGGLRGAVRILGLAEADAEVVVRITWEDGAQQSWVLTKAQPMFIAGTSQGEAPQGLSAWIVIGAEHIAFGPDHLLFVLGLVLLVSSWRRLLSTITAFTIAHSITLAGSALLGWSLPGGPVEVLIALSILLLAVELLGDPNSLTWRQPWGVAFAFGLLHGFGFAGALAELGLPVDGTGAALFGFNVGVELGQLAFVTLVIGPVLALRRAPIAVQRAPAWLLGAVATVWVVQRALVMVG